MKSEVTRKSLASVKGLSASLLVGAILTGCADSNIHQFLDSTFLNTVAPSVATLGKSFYPDRYNPLLPLSIPKDFADTAPDHIGPWTFWGFSGNPKENAYQANYYDPATVKHDGSQVTFSAFSFFNTSLPVHSKKPVLSMQIDYSFDCDESTYKMVRVRAYSTTRTTGELVSDMVVPKSSKPTPMKNAPELLRLQPKVCS